MAGKTINVVCKGCGKTFAAFLRDMAEQNIKVVCPACGKEYVKKKAVEAVDEFCPPEAPKKRS